MSANPQFSKNNNKGKTGFKGSYDAGKTEDVLDIKAEVSQPAPEATRTPLPASRQLNPAPGIQAVSQPAAEAATSEVKRPNAQYVPRTQQTAPEVVVIPSKPSKATPVAEDVVINKNGDIEMKKTGENSYSQKTSADVAAERRAKAARRVEIAALVDYEKRKEAAREQITQGQISKQQVLWQLILKGELDPGQIAAYDAAKGRYSRSQASELAQAMFKKASAMSPEERAAAAQYNQASLTKTAFESLKKSGLASEVENRPGSWQVNVNQLLANYDINQKFASTRHQLENPAQAVEALLPAKIATEQSPAAKVTSIYGKRQDVEKNSTRSQSRSDSRLDRAA